MISRGAVFCLLKAPTTALSSLFSDVYRLLGGITTVCDTSRLPYRSGRLVSYVGSHGPSARSAFCTVLVQ